MITLPRDSLTWTAEASFETNTHALLARVGLSFHLLLIFFSSCCSLSEVRVFCLDYPFWMLSEDAGLWYECDYDLCVEITEM